ncbi:hypothetical protein [Noviherbaspirillum autotrophicum]|uniref:Uncharacterized protein n=1 Tax=Noviherbaspirillum autotrophicum TaxID=709839 RepID=A0A0C2BN48_9BURK|nr:hypothetical protein [Noviherbaspirillum autotrophicum]KIF81419.1 hypothetical protein TSA66_12325 [Noviherbaspirillum autotrophicum]
MAKIVIKDLTESVDLDRKAMLAITGGTRTRGRQAALAHRISHHPRVLDYPAGFTRDPVTGKRTATR